MVELRIEKRGVIPVVNLKTIEGEISSGVDMGYHGTLVDVYVVTKLSNNIGQFVVISL